MKINWFFKSSQSKADEIKVGDYVESNGRYDFSTQFRHGPLKVIRIIKAPDYTGGKFVFCMKRGTELGFSINGLKKVKK